VWMWGGRGSMGLADARFFEELRAVDAADLEALLAADIWDSFRARFSFIGDHRPSKNFSGSYQPRIGLREFAGVGLHLVEQPHVLRGATRNNCESWRATCQQRLGRPASRFAPAHGSVHNVRRGCLRVQNGSCVSLHVAALVCNLAWE